MAIDMEQVRYKVTDSRKLIPEDRTKIFSLHANYVGHEYPCPRKFNSSAYDQSRWQYAERMLSSNINPNSKVRSQRQPDAPLRPKQAFSESVVVIASLGNMGIASIDIANNSSSHRNSDLLVALECQAKLHLPWWAKRRYVRLGQVGMMPDMEDEITADDGRVNVLDVAIALGLEGRKNNQPVRTYPRSTETAYQIAIGAMGLYRIEEHDCDGIKPLGEMC